MTLLLTRKQILHFPCHLSCSRVLCSFFVDIALAIGVGDFAIYFKVMSTWLVFDHVPSYLWRPGLSILRRLLASPVVVALAAFAKGGGDFF